MKKKFIKKWTACLLAFCTIFATVGPELALVVKASSDSKQDAAIKTAMENLEKDWAGYLYDYEGDKIGTGSVLLGDDDTSSLVHKDDYTSGGYTSMADYMYSFNSAGELVRDVDYSFTQDRKTGFLYYKTALTNFELNFEYKHSSSSSGVGWNGIYIGMGASAEGTIWTNEANNLAMFIQPKVHYVRCGSTANINSLVYNSGLKNVDYSAMETKWNTNKDAWYTYRLVMENKVATWYIDGNQIATYTIDGYTGGHIYFGTMAKDTSFRNIQVTNKDNPYLTMAGIEADFKAAFQDQAGSNFSASSPIITDENISDMENYAKYTTDGYTSLADYLFSVDSTGAIVRDIDYGIGGNRKNGFLYYDTEMTNFTLEMEYRHVVPKVGWTTMYVGMGAQTIGGNHFTDNKVSSLRIQPEELYLEQNGSVVTNYNTDSKYSAAKTKWQEGNTAGTPNWFSFKLTVADGVATWWIDNQEFSKSLTNYEGGYIFFGGMAQNTAFRNIKITNNDSVQTTPDYSMYDVYYATESDKNVNKLTSITKTDFTNCWSLEEGTFTRTGTGAYAGTTSASKGASMLYFNTKQYDAFEMTFDYSFGTAKGGWKWAAVGFGADAPGKSYIDGDGYMAFIENEGQIAYLYPASQEALGYKSDRLTGKNDTYNAKVNNVVDATWHSAKIKVAGGKLTMSYDGGPEASVNLTDYNGYVYLCAFTQGMQYKNVSITETSDADTSYGDQFAAYYLPNGKDLHTNYVPLTSGKISDLWTVNGETLTRSGSGTYAAGPNKVQGASMLYFGDQYTNFELSYDFSFNGTTATWKWVGAGFGASEKGKYYGDGDGFMARVEQEGTRFLMQGTSQVYENKTQIPAYRDVVKANTGDTSWHTYKLVVKGKNVEIHIDNHEVAKTTISGYTGGYVYLFSATPGMTIKNVNLKEVPYEIPELQKKFTAYYLPNGTEANANFVPLKSAEVDSLWVVTEDTVTRSGTGQYAAGPDRAKGASMLYFKTPYTNFSLSYDFTFDGTTATWKWVGAGFGASAAGKYYGDGDGYMAFIEQEGYRSMFTGQTSGRIASEKLEDYHALLTAGDSTWHSFNLVVKGDVVEIYLDNYGMSG